MTLLRLFCSFMVPLLLAQMLAADAMAQATQTAPTTSGSPFEKLAAGWTALATGQRDEAVRLADELLKSDPRSHHAVALKIETLSHSDGTRALDAYDAWLIAGLPEDYGLLESVARGVLRDLSRGADRELRLLSLARLAEAGDTAAAAAVRTWNGPGRAAADVALARAGDASALARLQAMSTFDFGDPQEIAGVLASGGQGSLPALAAMSKQAQPPVRAAAIAALGQMNPEVTRETLSAAAADPDPIVRREVSFALARQGDPEAIQKVDALLASPVADVRLLAAEALRGRGERWKAAILPLLDDENPVTRLHAARLLAQAEPERVRRTVATALTDPNPAVQAEAASTLERIARSAPSAVSMDELRKLLRSPDPLLRLHAAGALLAAARPGR